MRGGYQPGSRLDTMLDEIKCEAMVARASDRRLERDRAFLEIEQLADRARKLVNEHMYVWGRTPRTVNRNRPARPALALVKGTEQ